MTKFRITRSTTTQGIYWLERRVFFFFWHRTTCGTRLEELRQLALDCVNPVVEEF